MSKSRVIHESSVVTAVNREQFYDLYNEMRGDDFCASLVDVRLNNGEVASTGALAYELVDGIGITSHIMTEFTVISETKVVETTKFFFFRSTEVQERIYLEEECKEVFTRETNAMNYFYHGQAVSA